MDGKDVTLHIPPEIGEDTTGEKKKLRFLKRSRLNLEDNPFQLYYYYSILII